MGIKTAALSWIGGSRSRTYRSLMADENFDFNPLPVKEEMREGTIIKEKGKVTSYFGPNFSPSDEEIEEMIKRLGKMVTNCSILAFSGSSPNEACKKIIKRGIELAKDLDKISLVDSYGDYMDEIIEAAPFGIHNNIKEAESYLGTDLKEEGSKINYLKYLWGKGIKMAFLTDGSSAAYAMHFGYIHKVQPPEINEVDPTGSGDAFCAGICYALENDLVFADALKIASAAGALNASYERCCRLEKNDILRLAEAVRPEEIGSKMKTIDDSSTL